MFNKLPQWIIITSFLIIFGLIRKIIYTTDKKNTNESAPDLVKVKINFFDRCMSAIPYALPLLEGLQNFGQISLPNYPFNIMSLYRRTLLPVVYFYVSYPALSLIIFFVLYYLFVRTKSPLPQRPFIRFNVLQSILLFLVNSLLGVTFRAIPTGLRTSAYGVLVCNTFLGFVLSTLIYSISKSLQGKYASIPVISQAVHMQFDEL